MQDILKYKCNFIFNILKLTTYNTVCSVKIDETQIHFMTGNSTAVIQTKNDFMLQQMFVYIRHTFLQIVA